MRPSTITSCPGLALDRCIVRGALRLERGMNLEQRSSLLKQEADKGSKVQADEGFGQPLVVLGQPAEARGPGKGTG